MYFLIICLMSQIKQVDKQQLFFTSSILISQKGVWKNPLVYILRLLAGKFGAICTEFPLATFSAKKLKRICSQISRQKYRNISSCKNNWGKLLIFLCNMKMTAWTFDFPRKKILIANNPSLMFPTQHTKKQHEEINPFR